MNIVDEELETEIFWDAKSCQEDEDINCQSDVKKEQFWDSLASLDGNIKTHTEVDTEVDHHDKVVIDVQKESSKGNLIERNHNIKKAWDNIYMDEAFKSKLDSKSVTWNTINNNEDTIDKENENKDKSDITTSKETRKLKTSLCDNISSPDRTDPGNIARAKKRHQRKGRPGNTFIPNLIFFSVIVGKIALGKEVGGLLEKNRIEKGNLPPLLQNELSEEEVIKRQIDGETFRAFKCQEESMSTAAFSLNPPPECRTED